MSCPETKRKDAKMRRGRATSAVVLGLAYTGGPEPVEGQPGDERETPRFEALLDDPKNNAPLF
jgi:hypothetical protein